MRNLLKILSVTVIIGVLFSLAGCGSIAKKISNEVGAKITSAINDAKDTTDEDTGDTTDEDTGDTTADDTKDTADTSGDSTKITTSGGKSMAWPKGMGDIKPVSCKISSVIKLGASITVSFEGMGAAESEKYIADFESMGFTEGAASQDGSETQFLKSDKDGNNIWFGYKSDGTGFIMYTPVAK